MSTNSSKYLVVRHKDKLTLFHETLIIEKYGRVTSEKQILEHLSEWVDNPTLEQASESIYYLREGSI